MYSIFTYIWAICWVNVGKYSIHGAYWIHEKTYKHIQTRTAASIDCKDLIIVLGRDQLARPAEVCDLEPHARTKYLSKVSEMQQVHLGDNWSTTILINNKHGE
jgi:hypothetical protein